MRGLLVLLFFCVLSFGEESWWTTMHQAAQRHELVKQTELKARSKDIKESMQSNLAQIVVELQLLNSNIAKIMMSKQEQVKE